MLLLSGEKTLEEKIAISNIFGTEGNAVLIMTPLK